jgi:ArsR family transcriptional regulator, arsenate/arsenite/antimonite-responsive transcriptional repressor
VWLELGCCSPMVRRPLSAEDAGQLAGVFKALGDPVRLRLLSLIASHAGGEACVCDLTGEFDVSQPTISHHLKVLREAGLLTSQRRGTWVYYRVEPQALAALAQLLETPAEPAGPVDLPAPHQRGGVGQSLRIPRP